MRCGEEGRETGGDVRVGYRAPVKADKRGEAVSQLPDPAASPQGLPMAQLRVIALVSIAPLCSPQATVDTPVVVGLSANTVINIVTASLNRFNRWLQFKVICMVHVKL